MNETTTEVLSDNPETTESFITHLSKNNDSTKVDIDTTTPMTSSSVFVNLTTEKPVSNESTTSINPTTQKQVFNELTTYVNSTTQKQVFNESTTSVNPTTQKLAFNESTTSVNSTTVKLVSNESTTSVNVENSTVSVSTEYERSTTMVETTVELTTTEATTSTTSVPADCPVLKDCPFDYCAFARKLDNRGCPTCNCLHLNKSNITCPTFTCQSCLYGHYTDPNGVNINHYLKLFLYIQFF
jgi:hypothetical protein